jgi:hypothetical protein
MIRVRFSGSQQIFEEICEHCKEKIIDLHLTDVIFAKERSDGFTFKMRDKDDNLISLEKPVDKIMKTSASFISKGLLDAEEAFTASRDRGFKYGSRPEAMCSQSIDTVTGITASFCYKTTNNNFLLKYSSSFHTGSEVETTDSGSKVGVDRKGNIIRMKAIKNINIETGVPESDSNIKYKGPLETVWFRRLDARTQKRYIDGAQSCDAYVARYGREVKDMTVVARYRNALEFITAVELNKGCRI